MEASPDISELTPNQRRTLAATRAAAAARERKRAERARAVLEPMGWLCISPEEQDGWRKYREAYRANGIEHMALSLTAYVDAVRAGEQQPW